MRICLIANYPANSLVIALENIITIDSGFMKKITLIFIDRETETVTAISKKYNIKLIVANLNIKHTNRDFCISLLDALKNEMIDYCLMFTKYIIKSEVLKEFKNKIINFHPSVLPACKGLNAIDQSIKQHSLLLGITAHFIDESIDGGYPIIQYILPSQFFREYKDVLNKTAVLMVQIIEWLSQNRIMVTENGSVVNQADYRVSSFIPKLDAKLAIELHNRLKICEE